MRGVTRSRSSRGLARLSGRSWSILVTPAWLEVSPEMNREIASAPEKSEADFCSRRAAALSRPRHRTVHTPPDWLLKRVYGAERENDVVVLKLPYARRAYK